MDTEARNALALIRRCVRTGRCRVLAHFTQRMDQRGLFWPDIQAVLDVPSTVRYAGPDDQGRPKWAIAGKATDGLDLEIVCALDIDARGHVTVFITAYWNGD